MRYDPESVNDNLVPTDTWCQALIVNAEEKTSKGGNPMLQVDFQIYDNAGLRPIISQYFVASKPGFLKKLCLVIGHDFDSGETNASHLKDKSLWVLVKIQKDTTGQFSDKNVIAAFSKESPTGQIAQPQHGGSVNAKDLGHDPNESPF